MKAISFCRPHSGGLYRVFESLRHGLAPFGVGLRWVAVGRSASLGLKAVATSEDLRVGEVVAPEEDQSDRLARILFDYVASDCPDQVIFHVLGGGIETSLARYLPEGVCRILVVHSITPATYRAARAVRDWVHATVAVSPRIRSDLVRLCGFDSRWTFAILNAVDLDRYADIVRDRPSAGPLRVLVHSRMDNSAKGILWVPKIVYQALHAGANLELTVSGDGPDSLRLRERFAHFAFNGRVKFTGWTAAEKVPLLMAAHDVLLFPSRYEGLGLVLMEAMAAGCVPVASRIRGVTDFVVRDGEEGLLFPMGDLKAAANNLVRLDRDRTLLARLSAVGRRAAASRFGLANQAEEYWQVFQQVAENPRPIKAPLPIARWEMPHLLQPGWWYPMPEGLKNTARVIRERWAPWLVRLAG